MSTNISTMTTTTIDPLAVVSSISSSTVTNNYHHAHRQAYQYESASYVNKSFETNMKLNVTSTGTGVTDDNFYKNLFTIICYSLIIFVSLCGNTLVLRVIASRKRLQTTTNILIASLAMADVLTTTLNIPFNVARFLSLNYPFGALFCKLVPFIQVCCVYVSTLTMGVIAIHRHITVSCLKRYQTSSGLVTGGKRGIMSPLSGTARLGIIIVIVWLVAGILAVPHSMFNQIVLVPYRNVTYVRCRAEYPKFEFNFPFWLSVEAFLTQYL
ncbi:hypothetical protein RDWZM_003776 [Blomia tropicalis]|uniref:G-protein coupled receptors family 1 profile domain-containing protein n=1 Tax=Blomia tropicalis TaxID=40697 RepID=A0A9Q0RSX1_BLOTA|nr:hypothetical protein RDWZM_003776 [Blomia tropicalis]